MPKFHPKDICIGQNFESDTEMNGMECEVVVVSECGVMAYHFRSGALYYVNGPAYEVQWASGEKSWVHEFNLRKRPPDQGWREIEKVTGWNPTREVERT